jgi:hypothetical protein
MAAKYNAIPLPELAQFIEGLGFTRTLVWTKDGHEIVYERPHHGDPRLLVLIYTSCSPDGSAVRKRGRDAIRACLVCESAHVATVQKHYGYKKSDGRLGLARAKRINRAGSTASIFARIKARAREMYVAANRMHREKHCKCGAPRFSDSGKCVLRGYCPENEMEVA